jgi:soluble lytic murein transglycosylase
MSGDQGSGRVKSSQRVIPLKFTHKYAAPVARMLAAMALACGVVAPAAVAQPADVGVDNTPILAARDAWRARDAVALLAARDQLIRLQHPLAPWADYWAMMLQLPTISVAEVDAFFARWPDSYVADRGRNDWLLELGRRQDWTTFLRIQPQFRMADDREVACLDVWARYQTRPATQAPATWRSQAQQAWWDQKDADQGCDRMASGLLAAGVLMPDDVWHKLRLLVETNKPKGVQQTARHLGEAVAQVAVRLMNSPQAVLQPGGLAASLTSPDPEPAGAPGASIGPATNVKPPPKRLSLLRKKAVPKPTLNSIPLTIAPESQGPLTLLAFIRWASVDHVAAAQAMADPATRAAWQWRAQEAAWAWSQLGRTAAWRLLPQAPAYYARAWTDLGMAAGAGELAQGAGNWSDETLAWMVRAAIRSATARDMSRWVQVEQAVSAMTPAQRSDPAWLYWQARALQARAAQTPDQAAALRQQARELLIRVADPLTFYGQLASESLQGRSPAPPQTPAPLSESELVAAEVEPGIDRALRLLALGWRSDAVREWNFTLSRTRHGGLNDRELLAVAEVACRRQIWDRCINTSERTRQQVSLAQRYPTPFHDEVLAAAAEVGLDAAYMYGLIRQESRFIVAARSSVGASGLMQVMPATAAWTARKLDIPYSPELLTERSTNLRIGAGYLKLVLDDFEGTQAMAAAAYNAGPSRPRRWREGGTVDAAAWAENVPFAETRDYVKKVLANATVYGHVLNGQSLSLKRRLGETIGPRVVSAPGEAQDLP